MRDDGKVFEMSDGGSVLVYRALDDRGEELLDRVEQLTETGPIRQENGEREYWLSALRSGEEGIEPRHAEYDRAPPVPPSPVVSGIRL